MNIGKYLDQLGTVNRVFDLLPLTITIDKKRKNFVGKNHDASLNIQHQSMLNVKSLYCVHSNAVYLG